ncbi:TetR/AcrR family transcriptional regulator [Nocardia nova]|uniref:TetR/AcrR family transcriptional regulator n=1 Tax=Nocardia nova TaxID=37330 RepID=A0A2S6APL9_9NOCA|nr:TetR/AcrR family transcriptional regulator [Nocardia nova]PPJ27864.1 TetR/AcrR family transcriptional regulator [Nocardia nova]PPJ37185.1 TetR/AcrR family transcriptional regulator [Nocardia nova]
MSAPARMGRPVNADGEQTRLRIMAAAMDHIAEVGYAKATMKSIAEQAGLTSAAIYHYFPSKVDLVTATLNARLDEVMGRLARAVEFPGTLRERFVALLDEAIACVRDYPSVARFDATVYLESARYPDLGAAVARRERAENELYSQLVAEAVRADELVPGTDPRSVVDMLTSLTWGLAHLSATATAERHRGAVRATEALLAGVLLIERND